MPDIFVGTSAFLICRPRHMLMPCFTCHRQRRATQPRPLASSKHKIQCYISCKQEIPPVSWLFLSPQRPSPLRGPCFALPQAALASLPHGNDTCSSNSNLSVHFNGFDSLPFSQTKADRRMWNEINPLTPAGVFIHGFAVMISSPAGADDMHRTSRADDMPSLRLG